VLAGMGVVAPAVTPGVLDGDQAALDRLDDVVRERVLKPPVVRIKLWTRDGRIVYSDEERLIGQTYELDPDDLAAFATGDGDGASELSDLSGRENRFEPKDRELLEVYLPIAGPGGEPLLYESYQEFASLSASGRDLMLALLPSLLVGLLVLQLFNLGLARWFADRLRRGDRERAALLRRALEASDLERRHIAADLHDGVVQDLTAVSLSLAAAGRRLDGGADPAIVGELGRSAEIARRSVGTLRTLLVEVYPPDLAAHGLPAALRGLVDAASARGLAAELQVHGDFRAPDGAEALLFRAAQEGLRNAAAHSGASRAVVTVGTDPHDAWVQVADDGRGFDPETAASQGHFGLRALGDLLADAGGGLDVTSRPGRGTVLRAMVPTP
jgi:two-component system NarL family sensor kinase